MACLFLMTPEGLRYYLPAYMLMSLGFGTVDGKNVDATLAQLTMEVDADLVRTFHERFDPYTEDQKRDIALFLKLESDFHFNLRA